MGFGQTSRCAGLFGVLLAMSLNVSFLAQDEPHPKPNEAQTRRPVPSGKEVI
jgi:hypothetical protein